MMKRISVLLMIGILMFTTTDVNAAKYAYSIGTNWGTTGERIGDYTDNALYAQMCYACINNVSSLSNVKPTATFIRSNNSNGNRVIASKIVFLNGHASAKRILFNHLYNSSYMTGVCAGVDKVDNGYTFAGLSSTDMSSCNLITFVGCETAYVDADEYNLIEKAVARGANTAVGFKTIISSTSPDGADWLEIYNWSLVTGNSVSQSIRAAADAHPTDLMTTSVQIAGDPTKTFSGGMTASASAELLSSAPSVELQDMDTTETESFNEEYIKAEVEEMDPTIDWNDYKVTVNMFDPEHGNGFAIFTYYIDGNIETNKAYVCHIEGNKLSYITDTLATETTETTTYSASSAMSEESIIEKVDAYESSMQPRTTTENLVNLKSYEEKYYYDYKTNTLSYREYIGISDTELDVTELEYNQVDL